MYSGPITLPAIVEERARTEPDRPLIRFEDDVLTGGQLHENALRVAQALKARGLEARRQGRADARQRPRGDRGLVRDDLRRHRRGPDQHRLQGRPARPTCSRRPSARRSSPSRSSSSASRSTSRCWSWGRATTRRSRTRPQRPPATRRSPNDPSVILFTSGTTGPSKGVVLSHNANFRLCRNVCEIMAYERDEVLFTAFPLFHVNAKYTTVAARALRRRRGRDAPALQRQRASGTSAARRA